MLIEIEPYRSEYKTLWDDLVTSSRNGTFLFYRNYMEYHADRFRDHSLLFFSNNHLIALLPANIDGDTLYSHQGLTYGGLILAKDTKTPQTLAIIEKTIQYLREKGLSRWMYKAIPHIYHRYPSEDDLYALYRQQATLLGRSVSSAINLSDKLGYSTLRRRQIKKAVQQNLDLCESTASLADFWNILTDNLRENHQAAPTHSIAEMAYLSQKFPQQIRLFCAFKHGVLLAGCLIFETDTVAHAQYISASKAGKECSALDLLFDHLIGRVFSNKKYFDFGTSTLNNGLFLNTGLISQKEGFGARGIVYDTYQITIK